MIHPHTELRPVNDRIGYGVYATAFIPAGTVTYVKDQLEIEVTPEAYRTLDPCHREVVDKYAYMDQHGIRIVSWDIAKYVNHRCDCNTMSTGYGMEIAVRDIEAGEEITDEYGLFNPDCDMELHCGCPACRGYVTPGDIDVHYAAWDRRVQEALRCFAMVRQPLLPFIDAATNDQLQTYLYKGTGYRSVLELKYVPGARQRAGRCRTGAAVNRAAAL